MQTPAPTLQDFVLKLLSDQGAREAFDLDPAAALSGAGLSDVAPQDVLDAIPLVLDFASVTGDGLVLDGGFAADAGDFVGNGFVATPFGEGGVVIGKEDAGFGAAAGVNSPLGEGGVRFAGDEALTTGEFGVGDAALTYGASATGVAAELGGVFGLGVDVQGLSVQVGAESYGVAFPDALGKGGDMVTGTVAGYVTDGADSFSEVLTDGAGTLAGGIVSGGQTTGGLVSGGANQVAGAAGEPTSSQASAVAGLPGLPGLNGGLPVGVPVGVPALPAVPDTAGLPVVSGLPGLPGLGDLPVGLPDLGIADLPELPALPAVPAVPELSSGLPDLPGVGVVQDTVLDVTGQVPVVGDLTDGVMDNLLGH